MTNELNEAVKRIAERMKQAEPYREIWSDEFKVIEQQAAIIEQQREALKLTREAMTAYLTGPTQQSLVMDAWDSARGALISNPTSSLGRDIFESVIDEAEGNLRTALTAIDNMMNN